MDIKEEIRKKIETNTDERLSIENIVCSALDGFSTVELAEFYQKECNSDLRNFLERRISDLFINRNKYEKLNTH
jgi:hypothetical protein